LGRIEIEVSAEKPKVVADEKKHAKGLKKYTGPEKKKRRSHARSKPVWKGFSKAAGGRKRRSKPVHVGMRE